MATVHYQKMHSGQLIAYSRYGAPNGHPLLYFHGSPGSRREIRNCDEKACALGLQIVSMDRPGMGRSDFCGAYTLLDHARDILEVADALGFEMFSICSLSGGAATRYSVACAAPDRIRFAIDVAGWAHVAAPTALKSSMAPLDQVYLWIARHTPWLFGSSFRLIKWASASPTRLMRVLSKSLSQADRAWLGTKDNMQRFQESLQEALNQGIAGAAVDARLRYLPWGYDLADISIPDHLIHGTDDIFVPHSYAVWKRDRLAKARLTTIPSAGHLEMMDRIPALAAEVIFGSSMEKEQSS